METRTILKNIYEYVEVHYTTLKIDSLMSATSYFIPKCKHINSRDFNLNGEDNNYFANHPSYFIPKCKHINSRDFNLNGEDNNYFANHPS